MWLVNAALRHPYTVWVGMLLAVILGVVSYRRTPTDILPQLKVPVVVVFASYRGMPAPDMEQTVTSVLEQALTKCDHLDHIESRSLLGIGIIQVFFRPEITGESATSQVIALVNSEMQNLPPGMLPPTIMNYDASAIPVGNLVVSSDTRSDRDLLDLADHQLREELAGIEGLSAAPVFGGVFRQVQIYVHPRSLEALGMSPLDVARVVNTQSQVIPTGEIRIGTQNYYVRSNAMVKDTRDFGKIPIYNDGRKVVYLEDVADVLDASRWRTNVVRVDGRRAVYMPLLRQAGASAVRVVDNVQDFLGELRERGTIPDDVEVEVAFDQSLYVRDALANLRLEAFLGAVLASLVVLLFLGNLRATWIVALSIPLSLVAAFAGLYFTGETLNIMTLGGLALVLGRVVDDSVVDVENTVRHLHMGKNPFQAALDSAHEIAVPVLMATVTTVIVFLPMIFMTGMGKYLFTPLAVSVALALFASYLVSRTVSPLLCARWLRPHHVAQAPHATRERFPLWVFVPALLLAGVGLAVWLGADRVGLPLERLPVGARRALRWGAQGLVLAGLAGVVLVAAAFLFWVGPAFDSFFGRFVKLYERALTRALRHRTPVLVGVALLAVPALLAYRGTGKELFPEVDSSEFTVHLRAAGGPRVEETERQVAEIENMIRGYRGTVRDLNQELLLAQYYGTTGADAAGKRPAEDPNNPHRQHLQAIRAANPEAGGLIDRILDAGGDKRVLEEVAAQNEGKTFVIPGVVPPEDLGLILSNVGLSSRWSAIYTPNNGPHAAFVRVQLRSGFAGRHTPTLAYVEDLRARLRARYPNHDFFFETAGMLRRILNNGAVAPIEIQVFGRDHEARRQVTRLLHREVSQLAGVEDSHSPQSIDLPQLRIEVDRIRATQSGLNESDVIRNVITALMSSAQIAPNFWIDPQTGNPYFIGVQYPEYAVRDVRTLEEIPVTGGRTRPGGKDGRVPSGTPRGMPGVRLEDVANIERGMGPVEVYHYSANRVSQLFVSVADNDLAGLAAEIDGVIARFPLAYALDRLPHEKRPLAEDNTFRDRLKDYLKRGKPEQRQAIRKDYEVDPEKLKLPKGIRIQVRGEVESMRHSFAEMLFSLFLAVVFVYLIMAAQFASWLDPLIMIVSAPLGLIGVALMLWGTDTSLNIQSCMGVLMMVGISVSNSVLLVEFANRQREGGMGTTAAVVSASCVRLRPILMTTIATLVGLAPMAIHLHPGDEMNLPLARAVIGGLAGSTLLTLFVVPILYTLLKPRRGRPPEAALAGLPGVPPGQVGVFDPHLPGGDWGGQFEPGDEPGPAPGTAPPDSGRLDTAPGPRPPSGDAGGPGPQRRPGPDAEGRPAP